MGSAIERRVSVSFLNFSTLFDAFYIVYENPLRFEERETILTVIGMQTFNPVYYAGGLYVELLELTIY